MGQPGNALKDGALKDDASNDATETANPRKL